MHSSPPVLVLPVLLDADTWPVLVASVVLVLVLVLVSEVVVPVPVADSEPAVLVEEPDVVGTTPVVTPVESVAEPLLVSVAASVVVLPSSWHAASAGATREMP
jgi:hypothetical protein